MRRFIFILMIALLPLRGWLGEAMATDMAAMNLIANKSMNTPAKAEKHHKISMPDCAMHTNMDASQSDEVQTKPTCNSCQACHATGLINSIPFVPSIASHASLPLAHIAQLTSASVALGQKPPIL